MVNWHVISDINKVHSGIAPTALSGCPYLFCAGTTQMGIEDTAMAGGRIWIGIPQDGNVFSETRWKWNMRWEPLMKTQNDLLTDVPPAVGMGWGAPVVFIKTAGEGRIFYSVYELPGIATQWREVGGVTDQPLAAANATFGGKTHLYAFRRNPTDGMIYVTRTGDSTEVKTWEPWRAIPGDMRTRKAPAAATMIAPNGRMLFVFAKREGSNRIAYSATADGVRWSAWKDVIVNGEPVQMVGALAPTVTNYEESLYLPFIPPGVQTNSVQAAVLSPVLTGDRVTNAQWTIIDFCPIPTDFDHFIALHGFRNSEQSNLFTLFHAKVGNSAVVSRAETVRPVMGKKRA